VRFLFSGSGNCYERVKAETEVIRQSIETKLGNSAEAQGVVILYEDEQSKLDTSKVKDKLIVEVPKARPSWFSSNLLQKTTAAPDSDTTTVTVQKPNLG
jgi:large subunit ribosomal protein L32